MKPCEAMAEAIEFTIFSVSATCSMKPRQGKPGEVIERMPEEARSALKNMTSDDAKNVRFEPWMIEAMDSAWGRNQERQAKEEFDKKIMHHRNMHIPYASNVVFIRPSEEWNTKK
jgi:hypothetical protein